MTKSLKHYFELTRELAVNDFKLKYNNSILGYFWSLLKPLALFAILYLVFSIFLRLGGGMENYQFYLLLGIIIWMFFAEVTILSMQSIVNKANLVKKIYIPKLIIVVAISLTSLMTFLLNLIVFFTFMVIFGLKFPLSIVWFPLYLLELYFFSIGLSLILATFFVWFRDLAHIWEIFLQVLFYATPIIYPIAIIPNKYHWLIFLNPLAQIIQDLRHVSIEPNGVVSPFVCLAPLVTLVILILGLLIFLKKSPYFAEKI